MERRGGFYHTFMTRMSEMNGMHPFYQMRKAAFSYLRMQIQTGFPESLHGFLYGQVLKTVSAALKSLPPCAYAHFLEYGLSLDGELTGTALRNVDMEMSFTLSWKAFSDKLAEEGIHMV